MVYYYIGNSKIYHTFKPVVKAFISLPLIFQTITIATTAANTFYTCITHF